VKLGADHPGASSSVWLEPTKGQPPPNKTNMTSSNLSSRLAGAILVLLGCTLLSGAKWVGPGRGTGDFAFGQEAVLIAHPGVTAKNWSDSELSSILLGKTAKWKSGTKVVLFNLKDGDLHGSFSQRFTGKTASQYKIYWKKRVFTGKGKAPKTFRTESRMIDYVAKTPGAIGYISLATSKDPKVINGPKDGSPRVRVIKRN